MVASLVALALLSSPFQASSGLPVAAFAPALGRPLAWDRYGVVPLDADGPLPPADAQIITQVQAGELARAEALARKRLNTHREDCLPAWILGQIFRVKRGGTAEYRRRVEGQIGTPATPAVLLYRLHVCRVAHDETMSPPFTKSKFELRQILNEEMTVLRDRCRPYASRHLGITIGITQVTPYWALTNRSVLESYRAAHPNGADVRSLICQAYNSGIQVVSTTDADGRQIPKGFVPDEPQPKKALEIAQSILKDRPSDPLGHFQAAQSYVRLNMASLAMAQMRAALKTGTLPPAYEKAARAYLETGSQSAFSQSVPY